MALHANRGSYFSLADAQLRGGGLRCLSTWGCALLDNGYLGEWQRPTAEPRSTNAQYFFRLWLSQC